MRAMLSCIAILVAGCASGSHADRLCPPLPELPAKATSEQSTLHSAIVIRLYAQCAGVTSGDQ